MAVILHENVRNAQMQAYETAIGASPVLRVYSGSVPADLATSPGTLLVEMNMPADWAGAPSGGTSALLGTWSGVCVANGTATHYRVFSIANGGVAYEQGTVGVSGTDLTVPDPAFTSGMLIAVNTKSMTAGNA